jgi:hypothetical protein
MAAELRHQVDGNLAWARGEVVLLVGTIALPGHDQLSRLLDQLARLAAGTDDPGRRLALLVQLAVAMTGLFQTVEEHGGFDRLELADALYTLLRADPSDTMAGEGGGGRADAAQERVR